MPLQRQSIGDFGRIEFRKSIGRLRGVVVGVPHGATEPAAVNLATTVAETTGAGLVVAYGFHSKRVAVTQPLVRTVALSPSAADGLRPVSIYPEFKSLLQDVAGGPVEFYAGVRIAGENVVPERIEVASTGFSFSQGQVLKQLYYVIRDHEVGDGETGKFDLALDPIDRLNWSTEGVKEHGVLMLAERGLNLRLPAGLSSDASAKIYTKILVQWIRAAMVMADEEFAGLPQVQVTQLRYGKLELITSARQSNGIVVAAPHGTFDAHTGVLVRRICSRTGLAGVVATGFTPTESGAGWRINVNRPTERRVNVSDREFQTERSAATYDAFRKTVLKAAEGRLNLYVDIHQNGGQRIEVATVGLSADEARFVKRTYRELRDRALDDRRDIAVVDLAIEPIDDLEVGAWAAKTDGILRLAEKSLHFELPADGLMATASHRQIYTLILTELLGKVAERLGSAR
jgi:hypothetical protein